MRLAETCAETCVGVSGPVVAGSPPGAVCLAPRAQSSAPCAAALARCALDFDTARVPVRETWRYDGVPVIVAGDLADPPPLAPTHDWDNRALGLRSDLRGARLAQCRRCGARSSLLAGVLMTSRRPRGQLSREPLGPCRNETRGDVAFPSSLHYQGLDVLGSVRTALADSARESFVRASGDVVCDCGHRYFEHPTDPVDEYLHTLCSGTRVKL